ncbi:hypothetical protein [Burkholderia multivorans]|uniref:hypothetical protein n=1 Tax=Burkholderia multivorans TaxID=87883 RepID=UPI000758F203|nr:hypothetical protein [Burkholderia multivorans]KVT46723.1 hypothetical protein WK52_00200 [Burkholderia multivorans]
MSVRRPERLRILGRYFGIVPTPEDHDEAVYGLMDQDSRTIYITDGQTGFDEVDTTLHEVMHAIRFTQGREYGGEVEEDYVRSLATGLTNVFRDNPGLLRWIANTLKHDKT